MKKKMNELLNIFANGIAQNEAAAARRRQRCIPPLPSDFCLSLFIRVVFHIIIQFSDMISYILSFGGMCLCLWLVLAFDMQRITSIKRKRVTNSGIYFFP